LKILIRFYCKFVINQAISNIYYFLYFYGMRMDQYLALVLDAGSLCLCPASSFGFPS
jgi:hypothetical protein